MFKCGFKYLLEEGIFFLRKKLELVKLVKPG